MNKRGLLCAIGFGLLCGCPSAFSQLAPEAPAPGRHALVVTVGKYLRPDLTPLPGTRHDMASARQMAKAMGIPDGNVVTLADESATESAITEALEQLARRTAPGDRVYIHFSGHGTRGWDTSAGGCVEGFMAHDTQGAVKFTHSTLATLLTPIARKTDKLFVMYDACHSGGLTKGMPAKTRQWADGATLSGLRPKFAPTDDRCAIPANLKTRNLLVEQTHLGALPQDLVYLAAARPDEISFDDENKGGLATQAVRACLLGDATDLDQSQTIDIREVQQCAQLKIASMLEGHEQFKPHHLVLQGNSGFIPVLFSQPRPPDAVRLSFTAKQALNELHNQRNAKLDPLVAMASQRLKIGKDPLSFSIQSPSAGWVYVFAAGSDDQSLDLLFPNDKDQSHRIEAGHAMTVPRSHWRLMSSGPAGTNKIWVVVTQSPIDLSVFGPRKVGAPLFVHNAPRARMLLARALSERSPGCSTTSAVPCSAGFGSAMLEVFEE